MDARRSKWRRIRRTLPRFRALPQHSGERRLSAKFASAARRLSSQALRASPQFAIGRRTV